MSDDEDVAPPDKGGGGGAPLWMATFSDMMSLLLAFFVLLFSFSSMDDQKFDNVGGSLREAFGVQRKILANEKVKGISFIAQEYSAARPDMTVVNVVPPEFIEDIRRYLTTQEPLAPDSELSKKYGSGMGQVILELAKAIDQLEPEPLKMESKPDDPKIDIMKLLAKLLEQAQKQNQEVEELKDTTLRLEEQNAKQQAALQQAADQKSSAQQQEQSMQAEQAEAAKQTYIEREEDLDQPEGVEEQPGNVQQKMEELMDEFRDEIEIGLVEVELESGKIIIRINEKGLFASGSADLLHSIDPILGKVRETLRDVSGTVAVAGHTDNRPISTQRFRSNWELSSARAVTVVHELTKDGTLASDRFQVEGYGDTRPIDTNDTAEGRAHNRRVEVIIMEQQLRQRTPSSRPRRPRALKTTRPQPKKPEDPVLDTMPNIVPPINLGIDSIFSGK